MGSTRANVFHGVNGHEPVGVIGERVLVGAITPCGQRRACLSGHHSQCGHGDGCEANGGWRFGNTIDGAPAECLRVPYAQADAYRLFGERRDGVMKVAVRP
jgi:threonine dehydrogenase-like Zn-dependent dehydrogenase